MLASYEAIAPVLLPHVAGRPLTLGHFPAGVDRPFPLRPRPPGGARLRRVRPRLQVYVPLGGEVTYADTKPFSRAVAELLEEQTPHAVVPRMANKLRAGKMLVDWRQNTEHKSNAVDRGGDPSGLVFEMGDVLDRVAAPGDLFKPRSQHPAGAGGLAH